MPEPGIRLLQEVDIVKTQYPVCCKPKGNFEGQGPFAPARLLADAQDEDPPC